MIINTTLLIFLVGLFLISLMFIIALCAPLFFKDQDDVTVMKILFVSVACLCLLVLFIITAVRIDNFQSSSQTTDLSNLISFSSSSSSNRNDSSSSKYESLTNE